jgi:hypothetical protein
MRSWTTKTMTSTMLLAADGTVADVGAATADSGDEAAVAEDVASILNDVCRAAVAVGRSADPDAVATLLRDLGARAEAFRARGYGAVAAFLAALERLLAGEPLAEAQADLVEPFREGLALVAADIAVPDDPDGSEGDWVALLSAQVATILRHRDRDAAKGLAGQLQAAMGGPGIDPDAAAFLEVLLGVLSGRNVRMQSLRLAEPYRSAYFTLEATLKGAGTRGEAV